MKPKPLRFREFFVLLLPVFFVFHGYVEHYNALPFADAAALISWYLMLALIGCVLFYLVFRSWQKAALFTFCWLAFHFFFGSAHDASKALFGPVFFNRYSVLIPTVVLAFGLHIFYFRRTRRSFAGLTRYLNLLLCILIAVDLVQLPFQRKAPQNQYVGPLASAFRPCDTCEKPDVYLIVADEYAGKKQLQDVLQFDNTPFLDSLKGRGFHVLAQPKSNYNYTVFSLSSMLTMNYLKRGPEPRFNMDQMKAALVVINQSDVLHYFKRLGYRVVNYSIFNLDNDRTLVETRFLGNRKRLITSQTFLSRMATDIAFNFIQKYKIRWFIWKSVRINLDNNKLLIDRLKAEAVRPAGQPRFVYTHLLMPHYPYYFDRNGKMQPVEHLVEGQQNRQQYYVEYLRYCNKRLMELVDHILKHSDKPPVILLMSDHGFREYTFPADSQYHFMTLNSIYLPRKNYGGFYDSMSNVNQFRVLFNTLYQQQLPLLRDSTSFLWE